MCEDQSSTGARVAPAPESLALPMMFNEFLLALGGARFTYDMPDVLDVNEWGPEVRGEWRVLVARCPLAGDGHQLGIGQSERRGIVSVRCPSCETAGREEELRARLAQIVAALPYPVSGWIAQPDSSRFSHVRRMSNGTLRGLVRVEERPV